MIQGKLGRVEVNETLIRKMALTVCIFAIGAALHQVYGFSVAALDLAWVMPDDELREVPAAVSFDY